MISTTTITQKGQMTLPKKIRNKLGIKKLDTLSIEIVDKDNGLIKLKSNPDITDLAGILPEKNKRGERFDVLNIRDRMEKNYKRL